MTSGPFCEECGEKYCNQNAKFCRSCGAKRAATGPAAAVAAVETVDLSRSSSGAGAAAKRGRRRTKMVLRCGWTVVNKGGEQTFVAPDGREFKARDRAAKYGLEPARKDGWQVVMNELRTHTNWIAPDGEKFQSYLAAKAYDKSAPLPLYGKDGITQNISRFFSSKSQPDNSTCARQPARPTQPAKQPAQKNLSNQQDANKSRKQRDAGQRSARLFTLPAQTAKGKELLNLCRQASIARKRRRSQSAAKMELKILSGYTAPRKISKAMANKVRLFFCL